MQSAELVDYGRAWSWHIVLEPKAEVELTFVEFDWTDANPADPGTLAVAAGGLKPILDKDGRFRNVLARCSPQSQEP